MTGDTIPYHKTSMALQEQAAERLRHRGPTNDRTSRKRHARTRHLRMEDQVLVRSRHSGGKFKLPFEPVPWTVVKTCSTMITATREEESVTRNVLFFKHYRYDGWEPRTGADERPDTPECAESPEDNKVIPKHTEKDLLGNQLDREPYPSRGPPVALERDGVESPSVGGCPAVTVESIPPRDGFRRYYLRPQPPLSSRLRDFVLM
ncbi:hypothetical protein NDU88_007704 [Pleurodeles waltl]|uniref:Uncharacterized protein n=1 Tax=Pleurodeles waltl TaxID=8319 RepID=A0AAV7STP9_PLEWA|nr:hypothetical protein NDU88_007704 [Pleurodeles waltl]